MPPITSETPLLIISLIFQTRSNPHSDSSQTKFKPASAITCTQEGRMIHWRHLFFSLTIQRLWNNQLRLNTSFYTTDILTQMVAVHI